MHYLAKKGFFFKHIRLQMELYKKSKIMDLKTIALFFFLIGVSEGIVLGNPKLNFNMLLIMKDGKISKVSPNKSQELINLNFEKDTSIWGGLLIGDSFLSFENKYKIFSYDLATGKKKMLINLEGKLKTSLTPNEIIYQDNNRLIVSATEPTTSKHGIFKSLIFLIEGKEKRISQIPISNNIDGNVSVIENKIYFTKTDGKIYVFGGKDIRSIDIIGRYPTISPNGLKLAYVIPGKIFETVNILNLESKESKEVISFWGANTVNPKIRWSPDSRLIAVHKRSDISPKPLYILDTDEGKVVFKVKKNVADNWFFENPK